MRFAQGFLAMLPLWTGAIPVGIAYGAAARDAGLSFAETQLMSLTVFSAAAQMSAVALIGAGMPTVILIGTALALNVQLLLLGLSAGQQTHSRWLGRVIGAYFLTDGAYGIALAGGKLTLARLLGAGVSMFTAWNLGTALGATAIHLLPIPALFAADFVAPLAFLAVLVPLVRTWATVLTVWVTALVTLGLIPLMPNGAAILMASLVGSAVGAWWAYRRRSGRVQ
ncbi:AzlC family ABC transporter permease [Candidatus Entotheonella palauensis]|uniref:AzlC family protein n=1 Tax=Candidatus Entotheonella gemina TaxID=1429439 RepID=W4M1S4_9BACT|nr:AzlC family ABC transporter permease [Candidatus Entotheonella palauensis]ETX03891.1 MAG: hypothetical protein ETSY2_32015 [Candidatus Entotheonella gemina]